MKYLSGLELAGFVKERQAKQVRALRQAWHIQPKLAIVTDTDSPVIETYIKLKQQYGADIFIEVEVHRATDDLEVIIDRLNARSDVQGIIVQLPLSIPAKTDEILARVAPEKDVDGLGVGSPFSAATPMAINWLLAGYGIELRDKKLAIVGRGRLVGAPLERLWRAAGLDVTVFEKGDDLRLLRKYHVVVAATGSPRLITSRMVQPGAIVVDAGTASESGKLCGDTDESVRERQDITITPHKGGVGPLTVAALFDNLINACLRQTGSRDRS